MNKATAWRWMRTEVLEERERCLRIIRAYLPQDIPAVQSCIAAIEQPDQAPPADTPPTKRRGRKGKE